MVSFYYNFYNKILRTPFLMGIFSPRIMNTSFNPKDHVAPGTGFHSLIGWSLLIILGPLVIGATILSTMGFAILGWLVAGLLYYVRLKKTKARLMGGALKVSADQFPEIYSASKAIAECMGMEEPEIFIVEDNQQNAFAVKHGSKRYVVLIDDIVYGAMATGNTGALNFILAHELAHHALGHTGMLRSLITQHYKTLSRLDEFSCDAVAHAIVGDANAARDALTLLLIGPQLFARVNKDALDRQAREVVDNSYTKKAENGMTHPLLLSRYSRITTLVNL
jgi:Zn-dependent protease with chaperone function